jgi:hypothetical protein
MLSKPAGKLSMGQLICWYPLLIAGAIKVIYTGSIMAGEKNLTTSFGYGRVGNSKM